MGAFVLELGCGTGRVLLRCYYPEEFEELIAGHGFRLLERWGGYSGEEYGHGPELILRFSARS